MLETPRLTRSRLDGAVVVALEGEFDLAWAPALRDELVSALTNGTSKLVVDLTEATFLDSSALGALVGAGKVAANGGGWIRLVAPRENVARLLRITQIDTIMQTFETAADAVASAEIGRND
jgi:anti-sigma B factor antagonist